MILEACYILLPTCTNLLLALALKYHLADIVLTYKQFKERTEEIVIHMQMLICVQKITEREAHLACLLFGHTTKIYAIADAIFLCRLIGGKSDSGSIRAWFGARGIEIRMSVAKEWFVRSAT